MFSKVLTDSGQPLETGIRQLTIADAAACEIVENDAFTDPRYRATREKFDYRLRHYPELCFGLFVKAKPTDTLFGQPIPTVVLAEQLPAIDGSDERWFLVAHTISSRSANPKVSDEDMAVQEGWRDGVESRKGATSAIHSFAVVQAAQKKGLGRIVMTHYIEAMKKRDDVDTIALLCQDHLFDMYKSMGYSPAEGKSLATFGGGGWNDMVLSTKN